MRICKPKIYTTFSTTAAKLCLLKFVKIVWMPSLGDNTETHKYVYIYNRWHIGSPKFSSQISNKIKSSIQVQYYTLETSGGLCISHPSTNPLATWRRTIGTFKLLMLHQMSWSHKYYDVPVPVTDSVTELIKRLRQQHTIRNCLGYCGLHIHIHKINNFLSYLWKKEV